MAAAKQQHDVITRGTGCFRKKTHSWETKKLFTSFSETIHLLGFKLWLLMSTLCCQISTLKRLVVSEYEVNNFLVSPSVFFLLKRPVVTQECMKVMGCLWCSRLNRSDLEQILKIKDKEKDKT